MKEDATLLLWDALEQLRPRAEEPAAAAGITAALGLLQANDPLHGERVAVCTAFARSQVNLALLYRGKKWFDTASQCLDCAERFDRAVTAKERANLAAARPGGVPALRPSRTGRNSLLQKNATLRTEGPWRENGDVLECGPHPASTPWYDWVLDREHEDCEFSVEFRSFDPKAGHDCGLLVGLDNNTPSYQVIAAYYPEEGMYDFVVFEYETGKKDGKLVGGAWITPMPTPDGFHRITFRVHGKSLRAQLDSAPPVQVQTDVVPRGRLGLTVGIKNQASVGITLRNLEVGPWPPLTEEQARTEAQAATQKRIANTLNEAQALIARKDDEVAASALRDALRDVDSLPAGTLRSGLTKSAQSLLEKADLLHSVRRKAEQEGARAFVAMADRYAAAGHLRAAHRLVSLASELDREGSAAKLALAQRAVEDWKKEHGR